MGTGPDGFADALRGLKERSGLSYGALAGRAHMSTSTLHRYCNGDAVPTEFAPVERLARLCGASRDEMIALHRRWIVADEARRRSRTAPTKVPEPDGPAEPADAAPSAAATAPAAPAVEPSAGTPTAPAPAPAPESAPTEPGTGTRSSPAPEPVAVLVPAPSRASGDGRVRRRRVRSAAAVAAVVALTASAALTMTLHSDTPKGTVHANGGPHTATTGLLSPTHPSGTSPAASPRPTASTSGTPRPSATTSPASTAPSATARPGGSAPDRRDGGVPLTVDVRPYVWRDPCSQVYVVDQPHTRMPPPPSEQGARGWVTGLGGVPGGDMLMELTVQGTGEETVVLHALHVRVVEKTAPLPWNAYTMGVGCGGDMTPMSLDVNLDAARPRTVPVAGQQGDREIPAGDFPYKVSADDPQMLRVTAHTAGHSVRWYLELEWSSGGRRGTLRIDDRGRPFATSATTGRPMFDYPLGGGAWIPHTPDEG
ncbi:helix-turn-helix domain-containing protein [Streptomyces thermolilacinus]|uniref:helix-turn-helix domain-containing protein n=1 Tax=Streptomyces thermolilacinus TaxID=285540 RepID=UPI0033E1BEB7